MKVMIDVKDQILGHLILPLPPNSMGAEPAKLQMSTTASVRNRGPQTFCMFIVIHKGKYPGDQ